MFVEAVWFGLAFSAVFTAILLVAGRVAPDFAVHSYPPAIQRRFGEKSKRGKRVTKIVSVLIGLTIATVLTALVLSVRDGRDLGFGTAFLAAETALMTFNLYDLVVLDWLVFCWWRPRAVVAA
ncbi:hypothetical protein ACFWN2_29420 [Lentzea sp. NPDC058436]|uniref:hypothetical protein n=1 Tax=Lentzea sp. NPDC058436 TaxID=3346499 RepID=UPI00364F0C54